MPSTFPTSSASSFPGPFRIAIIGLGGIGSTFAFRLSSKGHHEITAIVRSKSKRYDQLSTSKAILTTSKESAPLSSVEQALDPTIEYDLVIVTLLAHQVQGDVLEALRRSKAKGILFMFNQVDPEGLSRAVLEPTSENSSSNPSSAPRVLAFGMPFVRGFLLPTGELSHKLGAMGVQSLLSHPPYVTLFDASSLPASHEPQMKRWLESHVPLCIAFESIAYKAMSNNPPTGSGATWAQAKLVAKGTRASFRLVEIVHGRPIYPSGKKWFSFAPVWCMTGVLWGMSKIPSFRELLAMGVEESRWLVDKLIERGEKEGKEEELSAVRAMRP
ncbi:BQ5605_C010g06139 [Microbotryum silenes-dioicae]|uniref:BQ5605_C010g06139 protein n=1 Tax=Microbotryum silenes-dioicae TaxID=796604 RepID=A0A2X0LUS6_9BASI|nr:BQ5605_C010g06139 [Microbotryum silenes-dioicae]